MPYSISAVVMNVASLQKVALALAESQTLDSVLQIIVRGLAEQSDVALARVWLKRPGDICATCSMKTSCPDQDVCLHLAASAGNSLNSDSQKPHSLNDYTRIDTHYSRVPLNGRLKVGHVGGTGQSVLLQIQEEADKDKKDWIDRSEWVEAQMIRSFAGQPLIFKGEVLGVLGLFSRAQITEEEFTWLRAFADSAALAIANARASEKIRQTADDLQLQIEVLQSIPATAWTVTSDGQLDFVNRFYLEVMGQSLESAAPTNANVLILGETGSGKELIARAIHSRSARKQRPLVKVNCGAMPAGLVESELFGHVKGAFTGASQTRAGRFELADGGTLFLDEVGELPLETQVKLLRVLQEQQFEPVGSNRTIRVNVRIITATNRDLAKAVQSGQFRSDLYYRLNVIPLRVPALRERRSDIPELVKFFLEHSSKRIGKAIQAVSQKTMKLLVDYPWPGNIRELQNIIERGVVLSRGSVLRLGPDLLPVAEFDNSAVRESENRLELDSSASLEDVERQHILQVLEKTGWLISVPNGAGAILKLHPNTLRSRMKRMGIRRPSHAIS
jgi:transcriptional regulator with GAF, ATPase, and Fis domain